MRTLSSHQTTSRPAPIIVLGAGLAGSLLASYLAQRGFDVHIYERRPDIRYAPTTATRSINLALSVRGIHALSGVGIADQIMADALPMHGRMMHDRDGDLTYHPYSKDGQSSIYSVSRATLNTTLLNVADRYDNVTPHFHWRCQGMDFRTGEVLLENQRTGARDAVRGQTVIGADGAFSSLRGSMMRTPRFDYSQTYLTHGYKQLTIPPSSQGTHPFDDDVLHIWPRGTHMLIALPNRDGSFTATLFLPHDGEFSSFAALDSTQRVERYFATQFPDARAVMPDLAAEFFANPIGDLVTIRCRPWSVGGAATLIGDAAHAVVPFYGQGMNAAFEDCAALAAAIDHHGTHWEQVFSAYQAQRIDDGHAIATMSIEHYHEMRDRVGDPAWLFRKQVEHLLERTFSHYISRYEMISFTRIPHAEALRRGAINDEILDALIGDARSLDDIDLTRAEALIKAKLPPHHSRIRPDPKV